MDLQAIVALTGLVGLVLVVFFAVRKPAKPSGREHKEDDSLYAFRRPSERGREHNTDGSGGVGGSD